MRAREIIEKITSNLVDQIASMLSDLLAAIAESETRFRSGEKTKLDFINQDESFVLDLEIRFAIRYSVRSCNCRITRIKDTVNGTLRRNALRYLSYFRSSLTMDPLEREREILSL